MNIWSKKGAKVVFDQPDQGMDHHQRIAQQLLIVGQVYTVDYTEVGDWHTDVFLKEVPAVPFNSVLFSGVITQ